MSSVTVRCYRVGRIDISEGQHVLEASQPVTEDSTQNLQLAKLTGCFETVVRLFFRIDKRNVSKRLGDQWGQNVLGGSYHNC